jgi:four helix bundle protein
MKIKTFEEIIVWQKAKTLTLLIYQTFEETRDYSFRDQIQRAAVSIMNNIAEGFERQTDKEFRQGLFIAKGSCAEVRSMLYLAFELNMLNKSSFEHLLAINTEIIKMIYGLIKSLKIHQQ